MNVKTTISVIFVVGVTIFAILITQHRDDRTALKTPWFWVGFLAVWIFWSALVCALINNSIEAGAKKEQIKQPTK